ncbi:MAG: hypothetical protein PHY02_00265 [Phycisphaerae bacterium]|nr:hypothetical protein [Phycisphaerae bacterium]
MITKEKLLDSVKMASKTEESALPLYTEHINSVLFLSGFGEDKKRRIQRILQKLNNDSSRHAETLRQLIRQIESEDKDVY